MSTENVSLTLFKEIVDHISVGVFVVNRNLDVVLWNGYMENYSGTKAEDIVGENIFNKFPDLPQAWLRQKIHNVFVLRNFSFTSWEHRPYLFKFLHNRPITGGIDYMRQNCTFLPLNGDSGEIEFVCITLFDVTDTSIYESMLKNAVRSLAEASNRDALTGAYNRRFLEQTMSKEFARIKRYGGTLSFIIIDLDHFKKINDTYGHLAGDEILKIAAKRVQECLRTADTLSRYGGEEFAVMLPETPIGGAEILAQRLCDHVAAEPVVYGEFKISISASLGVAEFDASQETHEELIGNADSMLYVSKENGRNQVTVFHPDKVKPQKNHTKASTESPVEAEKTPEAVVPPKENSAVTEDKEAEILASLKKEIEEKDSEKESDTHLDIDSSTADASETKEDDSTEMKESVDATNEIEEPVVSSNTEDLDNAAEPEAAHHESETTPEIAKNEAELDNKPGYRDTVEEEADRIMIAQYNEEDGSAESTLSSAQDEETAMETSSETMPAETVDAPEEDDSDVAIATSVEVSPISITESENKVDSKTVYVTIGSK